MRDIFFTPFPLLETERLILRQLKSTDDNEIFLLRSDQAVNKYLDRKPSRSIDDARSFIQAINSNIERNESVYWAISFKGSDKLIGTIGLFDFSNDHSKAEIGFELLPDFQGKGIMQEATSTVIDFGCKQLGLHLIEAHTHRGNQKSIKLLEQLNFQRGDLTDKVSMTFTWTCSGGKENRVSP